MQEKIKVGIIQTQIDHDFKSSNVRKENINRFISAIKSMAQFKPDLIVLPDEFYAGSAYGQFSLVSTFAEIENEFLNDFKKIALENNLFIAGSVMVLMTDDDLKAVHTSFLIDPKGEIVLLQDKTHIVKSEKLFIQHGSKLNVIDTPIGKIGFLSGNDILFPEIARKLVLKGAEILIAPVMAPKLDSSQLYFDKYDYPLDLYRSAAMARASENQVFLIMVNSVGRYAHIDLPLAGNSMVCGPLGVIHKATDKIDLFIVDVNRIHIDEAKKYLSLLDMRNSEICNNLKNEN